MTAQLPGSASPRVPPSTGRGALSSQRRLLRLLTAGAIALLLFSSFGFVVYEREQHLSSATELASRRAAGLADDLAQTLRVARVAIEQLESRVDRLPDGVPVGNALETGYGEWARLLAALPLPFELHARDAAGTDFAGGERASLPGNPGAGRPLAAAADPAGWVVGDSARRGEPPERRLPIWRPARANTHGIAAYSVELSQAALVERFEAARDRQRGGVALFRVEPDGSGLTLLARAPVLDADLGKRFDGPLHVALKSASRGTFRDVTRIDGVERIVGFQRLDGDARDLVLGYGIETRAVLSAWRASMPIAATTTLMLLGLLLLGGQRMDRSLRDADAAVRALHSSEAQYRALAENLPDVLVRLDREGRRLYANPAIELATGSRADALIGKKLGDLKLPDDDVADWMATLERAIVTQRVQHKEFTLTGPNGARQWESTIVPEPAIRAGAETVLVITRDVTARREFEDALRRSELRFRLASSFGQVWDWDLATNRVDFPAELWLALGHPVPAPDETLAALEAIMEPDDLPVWKQRLKDHLARRRPYELEFRARTSSGELRCFETVGQAVWDETGRATYMAGTTFDITERRRLEDALRSSETRMRHLLSSSPAVIYTARPGSDFAATYCSENVETLIGYPAQEFLSEPEFWLDHVHPDDAGALRAHLAPARMPRRQVLEYRFRHRDGRWCWLRDEVLMTLDDAGGEAELIGSWTDITERREAEDEVHRLNAELEDRVLERTAELARSEARYRTIFETAPMAIGEEDWSQVLQRFAALRDQGVTDGPAYFESHPEFVQECMGAVKLLRMNRKMLELHEGHRADVDLTSLASAYGHSNLMPRFIDELGALWAGERIFTCKNALPTLTGRSQSLMLTMSLPSRNGGDDDDGLALVCLVDISEIDRLNVELDASLVRLRRTNRELETFTYSVSHDLKAPLRGIDGYSRLLLRDHEDGLEAEAREFLTNIRHATQQMAQLIDDLLAYSRLERRTLELTPIALHGFIQQQLASNAEEIRVRGIGLKVDVAADLSALGDSHGLAMALRNLVENALKFSRDAADPTIEVGAIESGGMVTLWVGDNGLGFDMKFHDRIFEIFQRLHRSETYPGTGVGLAIVRKAMERMGGRVWAESEPGRGATFFLQLPATA